MMRRFYEEKLAELKAALVEKESERDQLQRDLQLAEERNSASDELKDRLREKHVQIEALKKMQMTYKKHTDERSRTSVEKDRLTQLQNDVKNMKKRKAIMQNELASEKRNHMKEVNELNKMVVQKDREINKIQKLSNQRAADAEIARTVSKSRLEDLAQLKKALRLYKRGVGLDPVLVGRRQVRTKGVRNSERKIDGTATGAVDVDSVRDYIDSKVASVVRKEALVDKLAKEWEEYYELSTRLKEISNNLVTDEDNAGDDRETLEVQVQFKNDKIRKLGQRLRRQKPPSVASDGDAASQTDTFLFDSDFAKFYTGGKCRVRLFFAF